MIKIEVRIGDRVVVLILVTFVWTMVSQKVIRPLLCCGEVVFVDCGAADCSQLALATENKEDRNQAQQSAGR